MEHSSADKIAVKVTQITGSTPAFICAVSLVVGWAVTGPIFHYSEIWELVINTLTTIITFLMVFLIQKAQNKDAMAIQLKLNELLAADKFASNRLIDAENLSEEELKIIKKYYTKLVVMSKKENSLQLAHSIDEAKQNNKIKKQVKAEIKKNKK